MEAVQFHKRSCPELKGHIQGFKDVTSMFSFSVSYLMILQLVTKTVAISTDFQNKTGSSTRSFKQQN